MASLGVRPFVEFEAGVQQGGATSARLAAIVVSARERTSAKGNKFAFGMFSDATGQFEAIIFSDTLTASRALLEPGTAVLVGVAAELEGENMKLRIESIDALDRAVGKVQKLIRLFLDPTVLAPAKRASAMAELRTHLRPGGGEIRLVVPMADAGHEVELALPGRFDISPNQRGLMTTVPGVLTIEDA